jgi:predicted O-linked N-acetylglucosamine transferase (SPINDLY family)
MSGTDVRQALRLAFEHYQAGRLNEAERVCRSLLELEPSPPDAWHLLGGIAQQEGDRELAAEMIGEALQRSPSSPEYLNSFGIAQRELGQLAEAEQSFRRATALKPDYADAHNNLGNALRELGQLEQAERSFNKALALKPDYAEAHGNLGLTLRGLGQLEKAERSLRRAVTLKPQYAEAHNDLGATLFGMGRLEEAERCYRQALVLDPALALAQGNLIFLLNYVSGRTPAEIYAEHRDFAHRFVPSAEPQPHQNGRSPERKLRIGYVSGDLRQHPVSEFIEPVLARHDARQFEIFCYYNAPRPDAVTERLKAMPVQWREVFELDDGTLENLVREDAIDILVDLNGHTTNNRLGVFARKPAPVQATWLGYLNTTALDAMDFRITDACASPEGLLDAYHSEKLIRLPDSQWCYQPPLVCPEVAEPPPSVKAGRITFAALANPAKIGAPVIELWSRLLERVPGSRLLIVTNGMTIVPADYAARFISRGIAKDRLQLLGTKPFREYLALHHSVDVVLDTFPYAGGTTTCHALWMGVPVVSLVGNTAPSRGGASLLHAIGLDELVAQTSEQYVDIAATLAGDAARLTALRAGMRERMRRSPLMDADRFTRNLEAAYRDMWRGWCAGQSSRSLLGRMAAGLRGIMSPKA